jgi:gliding motility-associated-like protein
LIRFFSKICFAATVFCLLFYSVKVTAQPEVCPLTDADMTPTCIEACIICDIDGYAGTHSSSVNGELPDDFCTFFVHNAQWIAFQAASEDLRIELTVSNCDIGVGLEMAIYQSSDCENFEMVSNCLGGMGGIVSEGESGIFENTVPLVIGQYYYLAMDGGFGDNCDWTLRVLEGSTELAPLASAGEVLGDSLVCINSPEIYQVDPVIGVTKYEWYVNNVLVDSLANTTLNYVFTQSGVYEICVVASNVCSVSPQSCKTILVGEETMAERKDTICQGQVYDFEGTPLTTSGIYPVVFTSVYGCDSTIVLDLFVRPIGIDTSYYTLCEGDTITTPMQMIWQSGTFIDTFTLTSGCDSLAYYVIDLAFPVVENVSVSLCEGDTLYTRQHIITASGLYIDSLQTSENCDSMVVYDVLLLEKKFTSFTILNCENDPFELNGEFFVRDTIIRIELLTDTGCDSIVSYDISFTKTTRDTLSFELCDGEQIIVNSLVLNDAGEYNDTLINALGCDSILTILVSEVICTIDWTLWKVDIDCHGDSTGKIRLQVQNGALPIRIRIETSNGESVGSDTIPAFADTFIFEGLPAGTYYIFLTDQNGKQETDTITLFERPQLSATAMVSDYNGYAVSCFGYNDAFISLNVLGGSPPYSVSWSSGATDTLLTELFADDYEVRIRDRFNCDEYLTIQLTQPDSLTLELQISEASCGVSDRLISVYIDGGVPPYMQIVNGDILPDPAVVPVLEPGQYVINISDDNECRILEEFMLNEAVECDIYIPNVFSPDGNGFNDFFGIFVSGDFSGSFQALKIYDRWGNLVFRLHDFIPDEALWNGTFLGKPVEQGVYAYIVEYTVDTIGKRVISGDVTVVR